jgi:hypothetical protein
LRTLSALTAGGTLAGHSPPENVSWLGGLEHVEGYLVDERHRDVVLFGRKAPFQQCLHLDDLVVNVANVWKGHVAPYCSLDPSEREVLALDRLFREISASPSPEAARMLFGRLKQMQRPQTVVVGGVAPESRHAHVMIDADYLLKKMAAGLDSAPGVTSHLDRMLSLAEEEFRSSGRLPALGASRARFWFHLAGGHPKYLVDEGIVRLEHCSVVVLTERQRATADGQLFDSGEEDPLAQAFADEFSRSFASLTSKAVFAALENLFRLSALLRALHFKADAEKAGLHPRRQLGGSRLLAPKRMPPDLPGAVNGKEKSIPVRIGNATGQLLIHPIVCGGVGMDMNVRGASWQNDASGSLRKLKLSALDQRPDAHTLSWLVV